MSPDKYATYLTSYYNGGGGWLQWYKISDKCAPHINVNLMDEGGGGGLQWGKI